MTADAIKSLMAEAKLKLAEQKNRVKKLASLKKELWELENSQSWFKSNYWISVGFGHCRSHYHIFVWNIHSWILLHLYISFGNNHDIISEPLFLLQLVLLFPLLPYLLLFILLPLSLFRLGSTNIYNLHRTS